MNIIYLLIPLAIIIAALLIWVFIWAIKSNQFDDMEGPAYKILMDDECKSNHSSQSDISSEQSSIEQEAKQSAKQTSDKSDG